MWLRSTDHVGNWLGFGSIYFTIILVIYFFSLLISTCWVLDGITYIKYMRKEVSIGDVYGEQGE